MPGAAGAVEDGRGKVDLASPLSFAPGQEIEVRRYGEWQRTSTSDVASDQYGRTTRAVTCRLTSGGSVRENKNCVHVQTICAVFFTCLVLCVSCCFAFAFNVFPLKRKEGSPPPPAQERATLRGGGRSKSAGCLHEKASGECPQQKICVVCYNIKK